jgi:uncharacterized protein (DUF2252 family)
MATTPTKVAHPSVAERRALGKELKKKTPPASHEGWKPAADRPDPVLLLQAQEGAREPDLLPVRHGRMMVSPFTFYRGAARVMAEDLAGTPTAGLTVQLCGDAHLSNFGGFASPERTLLFDINDFDETLPGPFEYDVKRLAASLTIAARNNGFAKDDTKAVTLAAVRGYREAMAEFAQMRVMEIWYAYLSESTITEDMLKIERAQKTAAGKAEVGKRIARVSAAMAKAHTRDSLQALAKLGELVDGRYRIASQPPVLIPAREMGSTYGLSAEEIQSVLHLEFRRYRATLQPDRRHLLERFEIVDVARKVVGVGSVGTRCYILLLQGRDESDPLFLQIKEATASVLEEHLPRSRFAQHGERVVQGQRLMQAASDIFLGWSKGIDASRSYYWRQLRDMKVSVTVETMIPAGMKFYAKVCGWTLARAHARSGDPVAIGAYLGKSDAFDQAVADFSKRYADQNEKDYEAFVAAVKSGRLEAVEGV